MTNLDLRHYACLKCGWLVNTDRDDCPACGHVHEMAEYLESDESGFDRMPVTGGSTL